MKRQSTGCLLAFSIAIVPACAPEERGPILAGGRDVKAWITDLHDRRPSIRRQAVVKLGNVGDADSAVEPSLAQILHDPDALVRRAAVHAAAKLRAPARKSWPSSRS